MSQINVMHITDTLARGGKERVAVNLVNLLPRERYLPFLCTTRRDGSLAGCVRPSVKRLQLKRKHRFDIRALIHLVGFIRTHDIRLIHAHGSAVFIAGIASQFAPYPALIWHDHYGGHPEKRSVWPYRLVGHRISGIIAVSQQLADWCRLRLRVPAERIWYIPNFIYTDELKEGTVAPELPGMPGGRIVCVANFRFQKDHLNLLKAIALVKHEMPVAHLLLAWASEEAGCFNLIRKEIINLALDKNISLLGERRDVAAMLRACDIGVLSSASEAFPLALVEYGMAKLPVVATRVGQCAEMLDEGNAGILVPPGAPVQLAEALLLLMRSPERRLTLGERLHERVQRLYSASLVIEQICRTYEAVLASKSCV